jgi:fumarate reductase flavoprotein subunit
MSVRSAAGVSLPVTVPVVIVGAGAAGLTAALAAREDNADVLIVERDALPAGSTALSSGLIPAAGTRWQAAKGVADSPAQFAADIKAKNKNCADAVIVTAVAANAGRALEWLADRHGVPFDLVEGFLYSGHSVLRMHGLPSRSGRELLDHLLKAAAACNVEIMTNARADTLYADDAGRVAGIDIVRPDGSRETIGCRALVLACNGYGGNRALVAQHIPEMADALYFGHPGNQGDALAWGETLGACASDLGAYQGHGAVAHPHGILITWALMMEGGFLVNAAGRRFSNEHAGYSEQAVEVLRQPGRIAYLIYDERLHRLALDFEDYRTAAKAGAVRRLPSLRELAASFNLPPDALAATLEETRAFAEGRAVDPFGRNFAGKPSLTAPFYGARVTGALFHTQGGLEVDARARVLRRDGAPLPNLFAAGGAARGVSGPTVDGYLSGNGLLTAVTLGRIAGQAAARSVVSSSRPVC